MNKEDKVAVVVMTGALAVVVATAIQRVRKAKKQTQLDIAEINKNFELDMQALAIASDRIREKIQSGTYRSVAAITDDFNVEYKFNKIAIREE